MKILFFASIAEHTGTDILTLEPVRSTAELREVLHNRYPGLEKFSYAIAVNKSVVQGNSSLNDSDEVALLPPFSGG